MAQAKSKPEKSGRGGGGARTGLLAALLAVVAAVAVWLSDCVPGFGIGGGEGEGEATEKTDTTEKPEPEPKPEAKTAPKETRIEVGIAGCALGDEAAIPCADLCKRIDADELAGTTEVIVAAKQGSHADVTTLLDCLKTKKIPVALRD